jgi:selenocysteine-specific elongation factor
MNRLVVGTAGHIDHGKSALVKALTGTDPDRLPEEKARGITIDLGFAHAEWDGIVFSFVDVPGHEKFVRTMVAGAQGIDLALLVVASDDGVMPQTREHLSILRFLGVRAGVLVRTKSDLSDAETGALVESELRALVGGSFLAQAPCVAVSVLTGAGIDELRDALTLVARGLPARGGPPRVARLPVDRTFVAKGFGPVVTGTLAGAPVAVEERLLVHPEGKEVRVRRVEVHGQERSRAEPGERTSLNLAGVAIGELRRGQTLMAPGSLAPSRLLTVSLEVLPQPKPLAHGTRVRVHLGTAEVGARLLVPRGAGEGSEAGEGDSLVQLLCQEPLAAVRGERFVLRRPSPMETLGGGRVLDTALPRLRSAVELSASARAALESFEDEPAAALALARAGAGGISASELSARFGMPPGEAERILEHLAAEGKAIRLGASRFAGAASASELAARVATLFEERRKAGAATLDLPRGELLGRMARGLAPEVAEAWLALLAGARKLRVEGDRVGPPGASLDEKGTAFADRIVARYRDAGFTGVDTREMARTLGTKPAVVEGLAGHLIKSGELVRLSPDLVVHRATLEEILAKLDGARGRTMSVGDFRDLFGLTRKRLIPLLEHLDRLRRTRRTGDVRVVL